MQGYPTIKVFRGLDNVSPYGGQRKSDACVSSPFLVYQFLTIYSIISYMTKQALPAVSDLTADKLNEFKSADKVVLVGYFSKDDKTSNATFLEVANTLRDDYLFGAINDEEVAKAEGVKQPAIVLYKSFDEGKNTFSEKFDMEAIKKFAKTAATPLIGDVAPETYQSYMDVSMIY